MLQPQGFDDGSGRVCQLKKSLYDLKQSPTCWNNRFHAFMINNGFRRSKADPCIHIKNKKSGIPIVAIWVVDGFIAGSSFLELLRSEFKITERPLDSFMGIQVRKRENGYFVSQRAYVEKILQHFRMSDCNPVKTRAAKIHENKIRPAHVPSK